MSAGTRIRFEHLWIGRSLYTVIGRSMTRGETDVRADYI